MSVVKKQIIIALFSIKIGSGYVRTAFRFFVSICRETFAPVLFTVLFPVFFFNRTEAFLANINRGAIL